MLAAAAALRLEQYLHNRSFWLDESLLSLNLIEESARGLLHSLDYVQSAPAGFLLAQKGALDLFGESERTLRLIPFLASLAGLVLFWLVAERVLPRRPALLALVMLAANDTVVYQASEAKPYTSDIAVGLLLVWLTLRGLDSLERGSAVTAVLPLAVAGAPAVWVSFPSVFVLAACFCTLLLRVRALRTPRAIWSLAVGAVALVAIWLPAYLIASRSISTVRSAVFAGDAHSSSRLRGVVQAGWESLSDPGGFPDKLRGVALLCLIVAVVAVALRREIERFVLLAGPGILAVAAALAHAYPLGGRYSLFLVPPLTILVALGAAEVIRTSRRQALVGVPLVLLLVLPQVGKSLGEVAHPPTREHIRPLLQTLDRSWRAGDTLYVYRNAQYAVRFYGECTDCGVRPYPFSLAPDTHGTDNAGFPAALESTSEVIIGMTASTPAQRLRTLDTLRGRRRLWLLFAHPSEVGPSLDEEQLLLAYLDTFGRRRGSWNEPGAALYLFNTTP